MRPAILCAGCAMRLGTDRVRHPSRYRHRDLVVETRGEIEPSTAMPTTVKAGAGGARHVLVMGASVG